MQRSALSTIATTAALVAAVVFAGPVLAQRDKLGLSERVARLEQNAGNAAPNPRTLTDLVFKLNQMEQEMRELRGLVEDQGFEIDNLKNAQRDQYLDLDRRLTEAQTGGGVSGPDDLQPSGFPVQSPAAASPVPAAGAVTRAAPSEQQFPQQAEPVDAQLHSSGIGDVAAVNVAALTDPAAEKGEYNTAFDALKQGRYAEAARLFATFVERYPNGDYSDNAQYWLAESYYVTGNYKIALDAFQTLISRFPNSPKRPDGKLKLGYTYFSLKDWRQAETVLKEVIAEYPNSTVSRLAENQLRTMRIQGNFH